MDGIELSERPSPNCGPRRGGAAPDLVILHYTNMPSAEAALERLCDPAAQVSAHYLIEPSGLVWRLVAEDQRAWHAGVSSWGKNPEIDINSRSIGIELAHPGHDEQGGCGPFAEAQMAALERLLAGVLRRWRIAPGGVLAHSDVAPGRKIDPGEKFDWGRLARLGLARPRPEIVAESAQSAPPSGNALADAFAAALRRVGYGDWPLPALEDAFRRRWRPAALGRPLEAADLLLAEALAREAEG